MCEKIYFPLFCTANTSVEFVNEILRAAYAEQKRKLHQYNCWVVVQNRDQQIFSTPSPLLSRFRSDFVDVGLRELITFCESRFARTGLISHEDFGIVDDRTLEDRTILLLRWEQYTAEDEALLRLVWGDAKPEDEASLAHADLVPEDQALLRQLQGKATVADMILLRETRDKTIHDDYLPYKKPDEPFTGNLINGNNNDSVHSPSTHAKPHALLPPLDSPRLSREGQVAVENEMQHHSDDFEIMEGWRAIRLPIATAMRDTHLVARRSITDLLKIRSLFNKEGVLSYETDATSPS